MTRSMRNAVSGLALAAALAGCGGPPPLPPTVVSTTVDAASGANGGAPVVVRIYQLASPAGFEGAQFFPLFNGDAAVLKDDLVKRDELLVPPGQKKDLILSPPDRVKAIGVFAAYADYQKAQWRAVVPVPLHQTSALLVSLGPAGVSAKLEAAKKAP